MNNDVNRALGALQFIPADLPRDSWVKTGMAAHAAGIGFEDFDTWSANAASYNAQACRATWRSFKIGKGIGAGSLYAIAGEHGWAEGKPQRQVPPKAATRPVEHPRKPAPDMSPSEVWTRCVAATNEHEYIVKKRAAGVPLDNLKVVPDGDPLRIAGESMAGALVVPITRGDGTLSSLQFVMTGATAERLKARCMDSKLNLTGCPVDGFFTVGEIVPGGVAYICEGIGTAWACWQATGGAAVSCFGWGRVRAVAAELRQRDATAVLVIIPDVGKELDAQKIATKVNALVVAMPPGEASNFDANDYAQREGADALAVLLEGARAPPKAEPRYKLLGANDLRNLPPLKWRVRGVLPADGLAGLYGPSASGKSFLALDMAAAIAEGTRWFDCRVEAAPVVYAALEGEAGFKLRVAAWEARQGRPLPAGLHIVMQTFKLTEPQDVKDLAAVIPAGAVVFLDTLNRAAPTADENSSKDMGEILSAAKQLQNRIGGLVVLVHHTGKDTTKGLRGHSSLFAALDAAVEVSRDGDRREWKVAKSKDGQDDNAQAFRLKLVTLGLDEHGDPLTSCVVEQDHTERDIKRVKVPQGGNQSLVYTAIRNMFKDGISGKPGAPPLRPCLDLELLVSRGAAALTCDTDKRTSRARLAITGLVSRGILGLNDGFVWLV